nr:uncharacterized protein LOC113397430 [Vanessa tameamea]
MFIRILILLVMLYYDTCSATECTTRGRFPDNSNSDCRGFTMCLSTGANSMKYNVLCPEHSIYSHLESQCTNVTSYQCLPYHNCTLIGDYANPSSEDCSSYISCVKDLNNITTARLIRCPNDQIFSATENVCVNQTLLKCDIATESPKVLQVSVNNSPNISVNFPLNNSVYIFKRSLYVTMALCIAFNIIINV